MFSLGITEILSSPIFLKKVGEALLWLADKTAEYLLHRGYDHLAREAKRCLQGAKAQEQFREAYEQALAVLRRSEEYHDLPNDLNTAALIEEAVKVGSFASRPDLDRILRWSTRLTPENKERAREALELFFSALQDALSDQSEFRELWQLWEARLTRETLEQLTQQVSLGNEQIAALARAALDARRGLYIRPAAPLPDPSQVELYLREVAARQPRSLFGEEVTYTLLEAKPEELFPRTVAVYHPAEGQPPSEREEAPGEPLEQILAREPRLVLLGDPGAGKTTTLQHLAQQEAEKALAGDGAIPICVELKAYRGELELEGLLANALNKALWAQGLHLSADREEAVRMTKAWLEAEGSRSLLLFDALNEVPSEHRALAEERLTAFLRGPCRVIVTCRERDYTGALMDTPAYVLQGLREEEVRAFLVRFFAQHTGDPKAGGKLYDEQIERDWRLRDLAANPLMLRLLAQVALLSPERSLPRNKGQLFRDVARALPELRRQERVPLSPVAWADVEGALRTLGFAMQEGGRLQFSLDEAREWTGYGRELDPLLTAAKLYRFLKSDGLTGEPAEFLHSLFQEYFAADELRVLLERRRDYAAVLGDCLFRDGWEEVTVMLAGIYDRPGELVQWLGQEAAAREQVDAALLAYRCWRTSNAVDDAPARATVVDTLISVLGNPHTWGRWRVARALGEIGDPRVINPLIQALWYDLDKEVRRWAARALGEIGDPRTVGPLIQALCWWYDSGDSVGWDVVGALKAIGAPAVDPLIQALRSRYGEVEKVTWGVAWVLGEIGAPAVNPLIQALRDPDRGVRWGAAEALGEIGDPRALSELERVVREDMGKTPWGSVAEAAREAVKQIRKRRGR